MLDPFIYSRLAYYASRLHPSDWAAWVQAVGSILAIAAGVLTLQWQGRREREATVDEEVRCLQIIANTFFQCRMKLLAIVDIFSGSSPFIENARAGLRRDVEALIAIPILEIPDAKICMAISHIAMYHDRVERESSKVYSPETEKSYRASVRKELVILDEWMARAELTAQEALWLRHADVIYQNANYQDVWIQTPPAKYGPHAPGAAK